MVNCFSALLHTHRTLCLPLSFSTLLQYMQLICHMYFLPLRHFVSQLWKSESMLWKICDYWRPKVNDEFNSVWNKKWGKTQLTVAMEHNLEDYDFGLKDANVKSLKKNTDNVIKPNKCNQFDSASSHAGHLRRHLIIHSGEKSNKCNQCDYAYFRASDLKKH